MIDTDYAVYQVLEMPSLTETMQSEYRVFIAEPIPVKVFTLAAPELVTPIASPMVYVPKTARGRRMMELRRLAKEAGEAFLPPELVIAEIRKMRE